MVKSGVWRLGFATFTAVCLTLATLIGLSAGASAAQYSSIVIDAQTGQVVSQYNADSANYPASLTKMMTLYLTFEALEHHRITLDTRFPVSAHAAAQEPTKLNLIAGDTVAVHDLILGLVTQSANDAAVVLGEGLAGGSEAAFAEHMTQTARAMGMDRTTFHNASGLPNPFQFTTARDLSTLARRLYVDFPQDYHYFATEEFTYHGVNYANHNHLMNSFAGMDGIKTGFIHASGFNLAASAVRNNRRLIGVVMGGVSARARDVKMASLLNAAFDGRPSPDIMMAGNQQPRMMAVAQPRPSDQQPPDPASDRAPRGRQPRQPIADRPRRSGDAGAERGALDHPGRRLPRACHGGTRRHRSPRPCAGGGRQAGNRRRDALAPWRRLQRADRRSDRQRSACGVRHAAPRAPRLRRARAVVEACGSRKPAA